jgi:hypothetical protein
MDPRIQIRIRIHTKMSWIRNTCMPQVHVACVVGLVAAMSVQGLANLSAQRAIVGEYSDVQLEEMLEWINANVPPTGVFAGTCNQSCGSGIRIFPSRIHCQNDSGSRILIRIK